MKTATFLLPALLAFCPPAFTQAQAPQASKAQAEAEAEYKAYAREYDLLVGVYKNALASKPKGGADLQAIAFNNAFRRFTERKTAVWMENGVSLFEASEKAGPEDLGAKLGASISGSGDFPAFHSAMEPQLKTAHREMLRWAKNAMDMAADLKKLQGAQGQPKEAAKLRAELQGKTAEMQKQAARWRGIAEGSVNRAQSAADELDAAFDARTKAGQMQAAPGKQIVYRSGLQREAGGDLVYTREYFEVDKADAGNTAKRAQLMRDGKLPPPLGEREVIRVQAADSKDFWDGVEAMKKQMAEREGSNAGRLAIAAAAKDGAANGDRAAQLKGAAGGAMYLAMDPSTLDKSIDKVKAAQAEAATKIQDALEERADKAKGLYKQKEKDRQQLSKESVTHPDPKVREAAYKRLKALDDEYYQKGQELDKQIEKDNQAHKDRIERLKVEQAAMEAAKKRNAEALASYEAAQKKQEAETQELERRREFRGSYDSVRLELRRYFWPNGDQVDRFYLSEAKDARQLEDGFIASGKSPSEYMKRLFKEFQPRDKANMEAAKKQFDAQVLNQ